MTDRRALRAFVAESNRIERIPIVRAREVEAHEAFLAEPPTVETLKRLVKILQPDAVLRRHAGLNVRVGPHVAPPGGPAIEEQLRALLAVIRAGARDPCLTHTEYETLHPFTDGNGRSGRALWLYQMGGTERIPLGFLHHWYYQTLERIRRGVP